MPWHPFHNRCSLNIWWWGIPSLQLWLGGVGERLHDSDHTVLFHSCPPPALLVLVNLKETADPAANTRSAPCRDEDLKKTVFSSSKLWGDKKVLGNEFSSNTKPWFKMQSCSFWNCWSLPIVCVTEDTNINMQNVCRMLKIHDFLINTGMKMLRSGSQDVLLMVWDRKHTN